MKSITFRPLRVIKKTGKITVASYMQWRKVMTADYNKFNLTVLDDYKKMDLEALVHDHNGELLFFPVYNPADVPVFQYAKGWDVDFEALRKEHGGYGIIWDYDSLHTHYNQLGMDCDGVPTFCHYTADIIAGNYNDLDKINQFEPLTVRTVVMWIGWFLYQLENSYLQIGK